MSIPFYGLPGTLEYQYTRAVNIRYPKVRVREAMKSQITVHRVLSGVFIGRNKFPFSRHI
jgi:hypothetical protein